MELYLVTPSLRNDLKISLLTMQCTYVDGPSTRVVETELQTPIICERSVCLSYTSPISITTSKPPASNLLSLMHLANKFAGEQNRYRRPRDVTSGMSSAQYACAARRPQSTPHIGAISFTSAVQLQLTIS